MQFITFVIVLVITIIKALRAEAYLSTRISKNVDLGWTFEGNIALSKERAQQENMEVLNPTCIEGGMVKGWTQTQFMTLWVIVIRVMAFFGKSMISYREDLIGSRGCRAEVELAKKLGMTVIER